MLVVGGLNRTMDNWQMRQVCYSERSRAQSAAKSKNPFHPAIGKETDPSALLSGARLSCIRLSKSIKARHREPVRLSGVVIQ